MTELILHIGPHRTGSTAIQRYLYETFSTPKGGIWYPPLALNHYQGQPSHSALVWEVFDRSPSHQTPTFDLERDRRGPFQLRSELAQLDSTKIQAVVLAAEDFGLSDVNALKEFLPIPITRVVYTVRRPDLHKRSLWRHNVRGGFPRTFGDVVTDPDSAEWPHLGYTHVEGRLGDGTVSWRGELPDAEFVAVVPGKAGVTRAMLMQALGLPDTFREHDVDRDTNAGLSDVQTLFTLGALEVVTREIGAEPTDQWFAIREAIVDVAFRRTMPDTSLHLRLDQQSAENAQALADQELDEIFRTSDRIVGDPSDARAHFVELFVHPPTHEGLTAYNEGREFGEQLFSAQAGFAASGSDVLDSDPDGAAQELEELQSAIAAEALELGVLRARVAQVEAQRDQMGRDLEIVRGWIDDMQRSESLRIGKALTAPARLAKRFRR